MKYLLIMLLLIPNLAFGITLQSMYNSAEPLSGYDKYIILTQTTTYTGGLSIINGKNAIRGNGAIIDLSGSFIHVGGSTTRLDIDHCILINGGDPTYGVGQAALSYIASYGYIANNTIYNNCNGVRIFMTTPWAVELRNNIIAKNIYSGVNFGSGSEPYTLYNDCWGNTGLGNYSITISCPQPWNPIPGMGEICLDPLFIDPINRDFYLSPLSPCLEAGELGANIGALGLPTPIEELTWGRIKALFK